MSNLKGRLEKLKARTRISTLNLMSVKKPSSSLLDLFTFHYDFESNEFFSIRRLEFREQRFESEVHLLITSQSL